MLRLRTLYMLWSLPNDLLHIDMTLIRATLKTFKLLISLKHLQPHNLSLIKRMKSNPRAILNDQLTTLANGLGKSKTILES